MSDVVYDHAELTVKVVERAGRIRTPSPSFLRFVIGDIEADLEPADVEALVAALDVWLEDMRE